MTRANSPLARSSGIARKSTCVMWRASPASSVVVLPRKPITSVTPARPWYQSERRIYCSALRDSPHREPRDRRRKALVGRTQNRSTPDRGRFLERVTECQPVMERASRRGGDHPRNAPMLASHRFWALTRSGGRCLACLAALRHPAPNGQERPEARSLPARNF